jgi:hypothetical protein
MNKSRFLEFLPEHFFIIPSYFNLETFSKDILMLYNKPFPYIISHTSPEINVIFLANKGV